MAQNGGPGRERPGQGPQGPGEFGGAAPATRPVPGQPDARGVARPGEALTGPDLVEQVAADFTPLALQGARALAQLDDQQRQALLAVLSALGTDAEARGKGPAQAAPSVVPEDASSADRGTSATTSRRDAPPPTPSRHTSALPDVRGALQSPAQLERDVQAALKQVFGEARKGRVDALPIATATGAFAAVDVVTLVNAVMEFSTHLPFALADVAVLLCAVAAYIAILPTLNNTRIQKREARDALRDSNVRLQFAAERERQLSEVANLRLEMQDRMSGLERERLEQQLVIERAHADDARRMLEAQKDQALALATATRQELVNLLTNQGVGGREAERIAQSVVSGLQGLGSTVAGSVAARLLGGGPNGGTPQS